MSKFTVEGFKAYEAATDQMKAAVTPGANEAVMRAAPAEHRIAALASDQIAEAMVKASQETLPGASRMAYAANLSDDDTGAALRNALLEATLTVLAKQIGFATNGDPTQTQQLQEHIKTKLGDYVETELQFVRTIQSAQAAMQQRMQQILGRGQDEDEDAEPATPRVLN